MSVLVIGGGGREHAICVALAKSPKTGKLYCIPGNAGISQVAECVPSVGVMEFEKIADFIAEHKDITMTVVAPDDPLAAGLVDYLEERGFRAFGPRANAAIIEGSKAFSKHLMTKYGIPTADYKEFTDYDEAAEYVKDAEYPLVVKADGLALGKGVIICQNAQEGEEAVREMMVDKKFKDAGKKIIVEEFLTGKEVSVLCFTDGQTIVPMVSSQDHKRAHDNDEGLNTGGMGTFSPSKVYTPQLEGAVYRDIILPTMNAMNCEGRPFKGVLYFGLMITKKGAKVLEYNARFGDPETQAVLVRLENDLYDIFNKVIDQKLSQVKLKWKDRTSICVIIASGGYPEAYEKGYEIEFGDIDDDCVVFHSGTVKKDGKYYTNGGRVLGVTCMGKNLAEAREKAYANVKKISFKDMHYRTDIGVK